MFAREGTDRYWRVRRPGASGAGLRDRAAGQFGEDREADDIGGLALVGRHPERGVALQMLYRAETLARGERDVGDGDIVLEIDEGFGFRRRDTP